MSLYLTRLTASYDVVAKANIRDTYDWHQKIWKAFEGLLQNCSGKGKYPKGTKVENQNNAPPDFLTRLDHKNDHVQVLIVSSLVPSRPLWLPDHGCATWQSKEIKDTYFKHPSYRFQLLANPTKKEKATGKRKPLIKREELVEWILNKGKVGGFTVVEDSLKTMARPVERFWKEKGSNFGTHHAVEFQGVLHVSDPVQLQHTFQHGIGKAKAFGFGLLCLAPLSLTTQISTQTPERKTQ